MKGLQRSLAHAKAGTEPTPRRVRHTLTNLTLDVTGGASTAKGFGSAVVGALPEGNILLLGGICYLQLFSADADVIAAWDGDVSLGTTATADVTLDGTDINLFGLTSTGAATDKLSPVIRIAASTPAVLDNTAADLEVNLNMITDDNSVTDSLVGTFTVNGYVELVYIVLGDD